MARFEACLLDYGNTIVEFDRPQIDHVRSGLATALGSLVGPVPAEAVAESLERVCSLPFEGDPPEYRELSPHQQMETLLRLLYGSERELPDPLIRRCDEELQDLFVGAIRLEPSTLEFLDRLRRKLRVGLVSNYPCGTALRRSLRETGIDGLLDPIVVSGEVGYVKPHASVFAAALGELATPPDRVLFVGDRWDFDMVGARDAGMRTCHHVGFTSDLDLETRYTVYRPDYQIRRIEELEEILLGMNGREQAGLRTLSG